MSYSLREASAVTGYHPRHLRRLLDEDAVPCSNVRGTTRYDAHAFEDWWQRYQVKDFDRSANLGPFRRRATDLEGRQVCPGFDETIEDMCGSELGHMANGRLRRLCDDCRKQADHAKAKRRAARETARRATTNKKQTRGRS